MFQYRQSNKRIKIQLIPKNPTTVQIPLQRTPWFPQTATLQHLPPQIRPQWLIISSEESIDLATLTYAKYQSVEGVHGITYRNFSTGKYDWTPVVCRRRRRKHHRASNTLSEPSSSSDPDSDSVLDSLNPADPKVLRIEFACDGRTPDLSVTKSNRLCKTRSWTPIAARSRSKEFK